MNWNHNRSIYLSQGFIVLFALLLISIDLGSFWIASWFVYFSSALEGIKDRNLLLTTIYSGSILAWILLVSLWKLLGNIQKSVIFELSNIHHLRLASWSCFAASILCLFSALYYLPFITISMAAAFAGLIVRIIKNVFVEAEAMKNVLDYTV